MFLKFFRVPSSPATNNDPTLLYTPEQRMHVHQKCLEKEPNVTLNTYFTKFIYMIFKIWVNGHWYKGLYEGLHILCIKCGCYEHMTGNCSSTSQAEVSPESGQHEDNRKGWSAEKNPAAVTEVQATTPTRSAEKRNSLAGSNKRWGQIRSKLWKHQSRIMWRVICKEIGW